MPDSLLRAWKEKEPYYEERFRTRLMDRFCSKGSASNKKAEEEDKTFGPAYDLIIIAFFIGLLYAGQTSPLDKTRKINHLGRLINVYGVKTGESFIGKISRKDYSLLSDYIFIALVAKCNDIDYLKLDKGEIDVDSVARRLMQKMEEYVNYGFKFLEAKNESKSHELIDTDGFYNVINRLIDSFLKTQPCLVQEE